MTVKELREKMKNARDDAEIVLTSDIGVEQCCSDGEEVIVEDAHGKYDVFYLYCNSREVIEEDDC